MYRLTLPAVVMIAMTTWAAPVLAAGEPQRARARGGDGGRAASAPRSAPRVAGAPARRAGRPARAGRAPAQPAVRAVPRRSPAAAGAAGRVPPRTAGVHRRAGRRPESARPGVVGGRAPSRPAGRGRTGAAARPPDDIGVFGRAVPRTGRPRVAAPGRGGTGPRVGADRYRPGSYRQARPRHGLGHRSVYQRHVPRPRFFYPQVYGSHFYHPGYAFDLHYGYPYYYGPRWGGYSYWPYSQPYYLDYEDPYTGYLRLKVRPREAEVYVDGYYVGLVDHFDGVFQRLRVLEGPHQVEIRHPGFRSLELEVLIVAGSKVTYEARLEPQ